MLVVDCHRDAISSFFGPQDGSYHGIGVRIATTRQQRGDAVDQLRVASPRLKVHELGPDLVPDHLSSILRCLLLRDDDTSDLTVVELHQEAVKALVCVPHGR